MFNSSDFSFLRSEAPTWLRKVPCFYVLLPLRLPGLRVACWSALSQSMSCSSVIEWHEQPQGTTALFLLLLFWPALPSWLTRPHPLEGEFKKDFLLQNRFRTITVPSPICESQVRWHFLFFKMLSSPLWGMASTEQLLQFYKWGGRGPTTPRPLLTARHHTTQQSCREHEFWSQTASSSGPTTCCYAAMGELSTLKQGY